MRTRVYEARRRRQRGLATMRAGFFAARVAGRPEAREASAGPISRRRLVGQEDATGGRRVRPRADGLRRFAGDAMRDLAFAAGLAGYAAKRRLEGGGARGRRNGLRARDGTAAQVARRAPGPRILLHGVSVGEVDALVPLARGLAGAPQRPDLVVSAGTATGVRRARDLYVDLAPVVRFPLDFSWMVRRFLESVRPDLVLLGELELWPSFMAECRRRGVAVGVVNGRLSEKSFRSYRRIRPLVRRMFADLAVASAQTALYRERFVALGAAPERTVVGGSLKWDAARRRPDREAAEALARDLGIDGGRPLVVAGSTGPGEEEAIVRSRPPGCQLLLAPRSQDRWDEVAARIPGVIRRSRPGNRRPGSGSSHVFLLDTIGELSLAYLLADAAFVGRSLGPMGGSNPLEPVALGTPTVTGPHHENFDEIVARLVAGGGLAVSREPMTVVARWLADPVAADRAARAGMEVVKRNRGVAESTARMALDLVGECGRPVAEPGPAGPLPLASASRAPG